jgi:DNA-directed RNA polymerase subunit RPC12/RpoP
MRSTVEMTEIVCPRCGEEFADWRALSFPPSSSTRCPRCGHDLAADPLIHEEGVWPLEQVDDEG